MQYCIYTPDRTEADPSTRAHTHKMNLMKVFISQKKMIRIITFSDYYAHTNPLFTKLKLLKLCEIYSYFMCICIYKYINSQLPSNIFDAFFTLTTSIHDYKTRHHSNLRPALHNTKASSSFCIRVLLSVAQICQTTIDYSCSDLLGQFHIFG